MPCPMARAIDVLGDRWPLRILRNATLAITLFEDLRPRAEIVGKHPLQPTRPASPAIVEPLWHKEGDGSGGGPRRRLDREAGGLPGVVAAEQVVHQGEAVSRQRRGGDGAGTRRRSRRRW